jgi:hypothetical protein
MWINPNNSNIVFTVADQGAVVSANRGCQWSNWYNQPTAAMYHVDDRQRFPYRVCSGSRTSGSACVDSRSMDGEITFHDWHPVNIQEYGIAAPDPRDPGHGVRQRAQHRLALQSARRDRRRVRPAERRDAARSTAATCARCHRVVAGRQQHVVLHVERVWKSTDRANSWTRISPDLTRQTWAVPANAGKYAST